MLNLDTLAKIADLTNDNQHGQALAVGARMLGKAPLADILFDLVGQHEVEGYLTPALRSQFDILAELLLAEAKAMLAPADYRAFKDCF